MGTRFVLRAIPVFCLSLLLAGLPALQNTLASAPETVTMPTYAQESSASDAQGYRTLQQNMSGEDVLRLKTRLQELGYFIATATLTDSYNSTMAYKVKKYQNDLGLKATGIATPELQALAFSENGGLPQSDPTPSPTLEMTVIDGTAYRTLQRNMSGEDVLRLKQRMQALGFFNADAALSDGYNSTMEYKVKQYQNALGVKATGIATPQLQALIFTEDGGLSTAAPTPAPTTPPITAEEATPAATPTPGATATQQAEPSAAPGETPAAAVEVIDGTAYRTLQKPMTGEDVLRLKQRMQELGFFALDATLTDSYNSTMEYKVKQYQNVLGEKATGIATPQLQAIAFSQTGGLPVATPTPTPAVVYIDGVAYRTLKRNMSGEDVQRFKLRLQARGYFSQNTEITDQYTKTLEYKVKQYQDDLGVKATGIATPELQATAFSDYGGLPTPVPIALPSLPAVNAQGFLLVEGEEYVYENPELGQWIYLSSSLRIEITRYTREGKNPLIWYETDIRFTDDEAFTRFDAVEKPKASISTEYPQVIADRENLVLAFNDDFYGIRRFRGYKQGVIIRDGALIANEPYKQTMVVYMPPLDILAFFADGSAKAFYGNEYSAETLLDMGVRDTLCFGPVLLRAGEEGQQVADGKFSNLEPRCALGMIAPRHYLLMTVEGRHAGSKGTGLTWIALRMQELGVQEAVNLDGGNTTALVFRGQLINKVGTFDKKGIVLRGVRSVSSIMGIGRNLTAPAQATEE